MLFLTVGKLAPIFAKKSGEPLSNASEQPSEDPEVARKRREFLMSGVPSELKRQAGCTAPAVIASDCAPFPDVSHVQQRSSVESGGLDVWSLAAPKNIRGILEEGKLAEMAALDLKWTSLQWQPTVVERNKSSLQLLVCLRKEGVGAMYKLFYYSVALICTPTVLCVRLLVLLRPLFGKKEALEFGW